MPPLVHDETKDAPPRLRITRHTPERLGGFVAVAGGCCSTCCCCCCCCLHTVGGLVGAAIGAARSNPRANSLSSVAGAAWRTSVAIYWKTLGVVAGVLLVAVALVADSVAASVGVLLVVGLPVAQVVASIISFIIVKRVPWLAESSGPAAIMRITYWSLLLLVAGGLLVPLLFVVLRGAG